MNYNNNNNNNINNKLSSAPNAYLVKQENRPFSNLL